MTEHNQCFVRRKISWIIQNFNQETIDKMNFAETSNFDMKLGNYNTSWHIEFCANVPLEEKKFISVHIYLDAADATDFTVKFNVGICKLDGSLFARHAIKEKVIATRGEITYLGWYQFASHDDLKLHYDEYLETELTLQFELELIKSSKVIIKQLPYVIDYESLLNSQKCSDFTCVSSDGVKILINIGIVLIQCPKFEAMIEEKVKDSYSNEATFEDIDSKTLMEFLRFIYCGKVNNIDDVALDLLSVAHKYRYKNLKKLCVASLMENVKEDNAMEILKLADAYNEKHLKDNCIDYIRMKIDYFQGTIQWHHLATKLVQEVKSARGAVFLFSKSDLNGPIFTSGNFATLLLLARGNQHKVNFLIPSENFSIMDVVNQVGVQIPDGTIVEYFESIDTNINFIIKVPE